MAALVIGVLTLGPNPEGGPEGSGSANSADLKGPSTEEWIACTELIAVGDVEAVRPGSAKGRLAVDFTVQEWIKPATGKKRIELDAVDPRIDGAQDPWRAGQHLLIMVPRRTDLAVETFENRRLKYFRPLIAEALEGAKSASCPPGWWAPQSGGR
ncbi:hypothetical protein [Streptomyces sp. NPDC007088]|uniref:hypothetical protein n=1 Tax=Streptomyces sp. NPDC007088 TaxID=3364773 RepID=UPI00368B6B55